MVQHTLAGAAVELIVSATGAILSSATARAYCSCSMTKPAEKLETVISALQVRLDMSPETGKM